jgi:hypothetical protein
MEGPTDYRQIHQEYFKGARAAVFSDEDYIVLAFDYSWREYEVRLISTTTCNTERSFCMSRAFFHYDRGLLFVSIKTDDTIRSVPNNCTNTGFTLKCDPSQNNGSENREVDKNHLFGNQPPYWIFFSGDILPS